MLQSAAVCVSNVEDYKTSTFSRVLFDNCSQRTYITTSLKKTLKLRAIRKENILIQRFASDEGHIEELDVVQLCLRGKTKNLNYYVEDLCVLYICSPLKEHFVEETQSQFNHLKELQLSETKQQNEITEIDILIGLDFYYLLVSGRIKKGFPSDPVAVESVSGWIISGPTSKTKTDKNTNTTNYTVSNTMRINTETLNSQITKFWEVESSGTFKKE